MKELQSQIEGLDVDVSVLRQQRIGVQSIGPCIYFLFSGETVVYVGQAVNAYYRVGTHMFQGEKVFDSYSFILCPREIIDEVEAFFIVKFEPKFNRKIPPNRLYKTLAQLKKLTGLTKPQLRKYLRSREIKARGAECYSICDFEEIIKAVV